MGLIPVSQNAVYRQHPQLGWIEIHLRRDSRSVKACWSKGFVKVTAPASLSVDKVMKTIEKMVPELAKMRKEVSYTDGETRDFDGWTVTIKSQSVDPSHIHFSHKGTVGIIELGTGIAFNSQDGIMNISSALKKLARQIAPHVLIPLAQEISRRLNTAPSQWKISETTRQLGSCSSRQVITLSSHLMFLTTRLRTYVIAHELAHLKEMNHSADFHRLLDGYLGGREAELRRELRAFNWPILR